MFPNIVGIVFGRRLRSRLRRAQIKNLEATD